VEVAQKVRGLQPLQTYRLTGWLYTDRGETIELKASCPGMDDKSVVTGDTQFVRVSMKFTVPDGKHEATVTIAKSSPGSGYAYADDIGLVAER